MCGGGGAERGEVISYRVVGEVLSDEVTLSRDLRE